MTPVPLVRGSAYLPFVEFLDAAGVAVDQGMENELVPAVVRRDGEAFVPMHLAHRYLARGAERLGRDDFGVLVGKKLGVESLGAFGRSLRRSLSLHDALGKFYSTFSLYSSAERLWWRRDGENLAFFLHAYLQETEAGSRYARDCALLLMRDLIRLAAGSDWQPEILLLNDLEKSAALRQEFGEPEIRRSKFSGISFSAELLSAPLRQWNRAGLTAPECQELGETTPSTEFLGSLRQVIATFLPEGQCSLVQVASALGMNQRTLQRKLAAIGQDYSELLSQVRFEKTLHLFGNSELKIHDIALELGFQDASNFSRSFRQWTGMTPSQFRNQRRN
ncbi:helix-turn-helix transcriptional regulator [Roseibium sp. M-1]